MQQRTAALTGKKVDVGTEDLDAPKRLEEESIKVKNEKESNERMVRDVEESVRDFAHGIEDSLKEGGLSTKNDAGRTHSVSRMRFETLSSTFSVKVAALGFVFKTSDPPGLQHAPRKVGRNVSLVLELRVLSRPLVRQLLLLEAHIHHTRPLRSELLLSNSKLNSEWLRGWRLSVSRPRQSPARQLRSASSENALSELRSYDRQRKRMLVGKPIARLV
ncbi:hypothetical protein LB505_005306 [Fusarium chuoi]|nr:hypothetical protein LB505_005306 [Fusarium chuoi]